MFLLRSSLLLFILGNIYGFNIRAASTNLDDFNTKALDTEVRKQMVQLVVQKASESKSEQDSSELQCGAAINKTIADCNTCAQSKCGSAEAASGTIWTFIGSNIKDAVVDKFPDVLSTGAKTVLNELKGVGSAIGHGFEASGNVIKNGAETALHGLTHTATDLGNQIKHGAETVGHSIAHVAQGAIDGIKHIFGKRMDPCAAGCPSCVKIDTDSKTSDQVLTAVCGSQYMSQKQHIKATGGKLQTFFNAAKEHSIISKVEYDPTSIDVTHGVAFKTVFITANLHGTPTRYQSSKLMKLTDLPAWAKDLSQELYSRM